MSMPNSSPATLVNLFMRSHALAIPMTINIIPVQTHTLHNKTKKHIAHLRCRLPAFYRHRNMPGCHQDNPASTSMWEPPKSTPSALRISTVNLHSTCKGELHRWTLSALWPHHLHHGNTHIQGLITFEQSASMTLLHSDILQDLLCSNNLRTTLGLVFTFIQTEGFNMSE